jgi:hypothetical protein
MSKKQPPKKPGRPATGQTPKRYFRMADEQWDEVTRAADKLQETASDYIRRVLLKDAGGVNKKG